LAFVAIKPIELAAKMAIPTLEKDKDMKI